MDNGIFLWDSHIGPIVLSIFEFEFDLKMSSKFELEFELEFEFG